MPAELEERACGARGAVLGPYCPIALQRYTSEGSDTGGVELFSAAATMLTDCVCRPSQKPPSARRPQRDNPGLCMHHPVPKVNTAAMASSRPHFISPIEGS